MNFEIFLEWVDGAGSFFLLPVLFWVAYFFWCRSFDYPEELAKHIRTGKAWPYLPIYWKDNKKRRLIRAVSLLLFWAGNLFGACALFHVFPYRNVALMAVGLTLSIFINMRIRFYAAKDIIHLQQDRYFQIYTQLVNQAVSKGDEVSDSELAARTQWHQQNDLRHADKQGRLLSFLRGEAKL